jgi:hypothetical protein
VPGSARVWMSTGQVSLALQLEASDALAVLRSYAYASDRTVDLLANDLITAGPPATQLVGTPQGIAEHAPA